MALPARIAVVWPVAVGMVRTSLSKPPLRMHAICQYLPDRVYTRVDELLENDGDGNLQRVPFESRFVGKFIEVFETERHAALWHRNDRAYAERIDAISRGGLGGSDRRTRLGRGLPRGIPHGSNLDAGRAALGQRLQHREIQVQ